jgi:hypothetical protein
MVLSARVWNAGGSAKDASNAYGYIRRSKTSPKKNSAVHPISRRDVGATIELTQSRSTSHSSTHHASGGIARVFLFVSVRTDSRRCIGTLEWDLSFSDTIGQTVRRRASIGFLPYRAERSYGRNGVYVHCGSFVAPPWRICGSRRYACSRRIIAVR